jgi:thiol peroxidase
MTERRERTMASITFKGKSVSTRGDLPRKGDRAPEFILTKTNLSEITLKELRGTRIVLNIFVSVDTPVCAVSVRRFNEETGNLDNTVVLCVSMDLPFALSRFCGAEGLKNVIPVSDFRTGSFGRDYGVGIVDGPLAGLLSRAVVIIDETGRVVYTEQVPEITREPDYGAALAVLR